MTEQDEALAGRIHHLIISGLLDSGAAPTTPEMASALSLSEAEIEAGLQTLSDIHGVVLHPNRCEPWIIHPFAVSPSATWVQGSERGWWAPCLWCAFGVATLAGGEVTIHSRIGGESEAVEIPVHDSRPGRGDLLVHFAIRPRQAWDNVHHHCAMVLPFRSEAEIDAWSLRHRLPRGRGVPLAQVADLARVWYGRHAEREWRKWTGAQAQAIFHGAGLTEDYWTLSAGGERF
jgi:hypothetical protein